MSLNEIPEVVEWSPVHYLYVEKIGPFQQTAQQAWTEFHALVPTLGQQHRVCGYTSLYCMNPSTYRAGVLVEEAPAEVPAGLEYQHFAGGRFLRFVLQGSYAQLPQASGRAWEIAHSGGREVREGFAIENYCNDPRVTPEAELLTEILIPIV